MPRVKTKKWAPSPRQAKAAGLERRFYPPYLRDLVDYDYDKALPEEARQWLAAFTEEHYRGWRLKNEEQVTRLEDLREAGATAQRLLRRAKQPPATPDQPEEQDARTVEAAMVDGLFRKRGGR